MRILIQYLKDDMVLYNASTDEKLHKAALAILEQHKEWGYYELPEPVMALDFDETLIHGLPNSLRPEAEKQLKQFRYDCRIYHQELDKFNDIEQSIALQDGKAAWKILHSRRTYQYERVELTEVIEL